MSCKLCESQGLNHNEIVKKCLISPLWVGKVFFNFNKLDSGFHKAVDEWFVKHYLAGENRFLVLVPRDHLKTTYFGMCVEAWLTIRNPDERILNVMATRRESQKTLAVIQKAFMSQKMRHFFPDRWLDPHDPDMRATIDTMVIQRPNVWREGNIEAIGLDSKSTGGHFTAQDFDDLIDATMAKSSIEQNKAISFVQDATNLQVKMGKDLRIITGTLWEGEYYEWLLAKDGVRKYYKTLILGCYVDQRYRDFLAEIGKVTTLNDGDPIWPEEFDVETLERIKVEQGPAKFSRQFLNIPTTDEYQRFREEDFPVYTFSPDRKYVILGEGEDALRYRLGRMQVNMVIDPATGEGKKSDETAISVVAVDDQHGFAFILEDWAKRALPHETIDMIFYLADKWNVDVVQPEDVSYQKVFKHFLKDEMINRGAKFRIKPVRPMGLGKGTRIEALEPFVRANRVCIREEHKKGVVKEAVDVVIVRGKVDGPSPNRLDALAYQTENWTNINIHRDSVKTDQDEIETYNPYENFTQKRAYGLSCDT